MKTPIDFGKEFLNRFFDLRDADACQGMLAGDLVWITPEEMHHFLSEGAVLSFLRRQMSKDAQSRYVDLISIKSSPSADNIMTVAYEVNLVSREDETPLHLRCSMAICRRAKRLEITFLHFSKRSDRDSAERMRDFVMNLPCGVMILACPDGRREEAVFYNGYFAHRLRYKEEEFGQRISRDPFFMVPEEEREGVREQISQACGGGGNLSLNLRMCRGDGNTFFYKMTGTPAYQDNGGCVFYCVFQEITGYHLTADRLRRRLDMASEILRQVPEGICGIEYPPQKAGQENSTGKESVRGADAAAAAAAGAGSDSPEDGDVRIYRSGKKRRFAQQSEGRADVPAGGAAAGGDTSVFPVRERGASMVSGGPGAQTKVMAVAASGRFADACVTKELPQKADIASGMAGAADGKRTGASGRAGASDAKRTGASGMAGASDRKRAGASGMAGAADGKRAGASGMAGAADAERADASGAAGAAKANGAGVSGASGRVFFTGKNIPAMFGVSNSAYVKNILLDPFYGLEMTSITRQKLLSSHVAGTGKAATGKPVSCGIFRLRRPDGKSFRVELVIRRVREKDGTTRLYLFYYDREAQQQEMEERVERAMKMGRAGQDQLRGDLRKAKEQAARRLSELAASMQAAQEKHDVQVSRLEDRLLEEKNRILVMSRRLEEAAAAQKKMAEELDETRTDCEWQIRSIRTDAGRKTEEAEKRSREAAEAAEARVNEADTARALLEEQLREAQERNRSLHEELQREKARRALLEEQIGSGQPVVPVRLNGQPAEAAQTRPGRPQAENVPVRINGRQGEETSARAENGNALQAGSDPRADWMRGTDMLTVFSSMDPSVPDGSKAFTGMRSPAESVGGSYGFSSGSAKPALLEEPPYPAFPADPAKPAFPADPAKSAFPADPAKPAFPADPAKVVSPADPAKPAFPADSAKPAFPADSAKAASPKDPVFSAFLEESDDSAEPDGNVTGADRTQAMDERLPDWERRIRDRGYEKAKKRIRVLMEKAEDLLGGPDPDPGSPTAHPERNPGTGPETDPTGCSSVDLAGCSSVDPAGCSSVDPGMRPGMASGDTIRRKAGVQPEVQEESAQGTPWKRAGEGAGFAIRCSRDNIGALMSDFLESASPDQELLREKSFSPQHCLENILIYEGMACAEKGIALRLYCDSRLPASVTGFGGLLRRALCELLENSIAHTRPGGTISVHCRADRPTGGVVNLYFRIDDNGTGIPQARMQTIFDTEYLPEPHDAVHAGIYAAREAATLMGGSIHARSGKGGTRFSLSVTARA